MVTTGSIIKYGSHDLQKIRYFHYDPANTRLIVFVHGGAWRDPQNTYEDFSELTLAIAQENPHVSLVGLNYRLLPEVRHPAHLRDLVLALTRIYEVSPAESILLVGHSVGATLILQLLNLTQILRSASSEVDDSDYPTLPTGLQTALDTLYFIDGIYDIPKLTKEYPEYSDFVLDAFGKAGQRNVTQLDLEEFHAFEYKPREIVVVQSTEDELLSRCQTMLFTAFLKQNGSSYSLFEENWGKHEEVYRREELALLIAKKESE